MLLQPPAFKIPIQKINLPYNVELYIKREDLVHQEISGNKYWKLFYNINQYLETQQENPFIITFGGAFSNHISATSAVGKLAGIPSLGIIRGEEIESKWPTNPTLRYASENGMDFRFVTRTEYRDKENLTQKLIEEFPNALIIPEGGTNTIAVEGVKMMLNDDTKDFDYLCTAVGTGGTISGLSKFCEDNQRVIGFKVVDDDSLYETILRLASKNNFLLQESSFGGYGKISDDVVRFINCFKEHQGIPLEPIYTGKMMLSLYRLIADGYFSSGSKILAFHTGGLQGIDGANQLLKKQNRTLII